jgi:Rrf2 family transcriptional regulator, iron-sulfur cluster assembly transcription factor
MYGFGTIGVVEVASVRITAQEEYGLRCILQLASAPPGEPLTGTEIARREGLSYPYVEKLLGILKRARLAKSHRGVKGGYTLARSAEQITLGDVGRALGGFQTSQDICRRYTGNLKTCIHDDDCCIRPVWIGITQYVLGVMDSIPISQILGKEKLVEMSLGNMLRPHSQV